MVFSGEVKQAIPMTPSCQVMGYFWPQKEYCEKTLEKCNHVFESESSHQSRQFVNYSKNNTQALSYDQINLF